MSNNPSSARPLYHRITEGIRVTVKPVYCEEESSPSQSHYVFAYRVRIENVGHRPAQLLTRRWLIHDEGDGDRLVEGDGVVGVQPSLAQGEVHEYQSYCVLKAPQGWMEGAYGFVRPDGIAFEAAIPRFELDVEGT